MNMDQITFYEKLYSIPERVVVDLSQETKRLVSLFGADAEHILNDIINEIGVKHLAERNLGRLAKRLYNDLYDVVARMQSSDLPVNRINLIDCAIALEQTALNIKDKLIQQGMYINTNYLLYQYDHTLGDGSVLFIRYTTYEDFCDAQALELYQPDIDQWGEIIS